MLRMVRYQAIQQDADRLRNPFAQDPMEALARTIHMGDRDTARRVLVDWMNDKLDELKERDPPATSQDYIRLRAIFQEMRSKIDGRLTVMSTELGYYSGNVGPDYGKTVHLWTTWATPSHLGKLFRAGNELLIQGHMGTGKTHLAVLFMEALLAIQETRFVIITNVSGVQDKTGEYKDRIFHVSLLSEILRKWAELPEGTRIFLVLDEPESNLRGGSTSGVKAYQDFRYMIRKLGIAKTEIWHSFSEQYKSIREDDSDHVYRIMKDAQTGFDFAGHAKGEAYTQRVEGVPETQKLTFATEGMGSIDVDVNMAQLIKRIATLYVVGDMKKEVQAALADSLTYRKEYRDPATVQAEEAAAKEAQDADYVRQILANPEKFQDTKGPGFDEEKVRRAFGLTYRDAKYLTLRAWDERPREPQEAADDALVQDILARRDEFLLKTGRGFDRAKIQKLLGVSFRKAISLAEAANQKAGFHDE
jgi:hypothetical protein